MRLNFDDIIKDNNLPKKGEKVVVAMSGGVDSSVVAVLLSKAGYQVIGVTMQLHESKIKVSNSKTCCSGIDIADAREVAKRHSFKHYVIDYKKQFKSSVIDEFVDSYLNGETPVPCIRCNQTVKFTDLINFTKKIGSKYLATGHYVRRKEVGKTFNIFQASDLLKDQSYFLFATTKPQLQMLRFPIGNFKKEQVRELAKLFELKNAFKPDSQDICFIPNGNYREFIKKRNLSFSSRGVIENTAGHVLGYHNGIINYTVGQRKGIGLGGVSGQKEGEPLYVVQIDKNENKVIVGTRDKLKSYKIYLKEVNLISDIKSKEFNAEIKIRSGLKKVKATVNICKNNKTGVVNLSNAEFGVAPGQACVFYKKNKMLGGGWITAAEKTNLQFII
ncbi:MAG: tRNA 2-thiouridine(34) synthase MnmA [Rickettsiales bacterium]|nr:tRNA 2-thiouridine(34) synthase MnmA [Rickettsiales bacterium]OUV52901.1 MAG: tRNA 2-thiouridine(34) synthase MnmA [Rickettsiales bacterium TMED127]|tara:strand:- start:1326 stop:2489 length:1164 start_codon:yes stop_codon:yes gene_type:complete